jgi:hypothetical protein
MIFIQLMTIIILFIITFINRVIKKQYLLFEWYCEKYYNLKNKFTKNELKYVYHILNHSPIELLNKTMDGKRLSFISYSHELNNKNNKNNNNKNKNNNNKNNNNVSSGRFAIGSIMMPDLSFMYALDILKERKIVLPKYLFTKDYKFGGLGWDYTKKSFKIYFRCLNSSFLRNNDSLDIVESIKTLSNSNKYKLKKIMKEYYSNKYWKEGLLSFVYIDNHLYEKKIYLYPKYSYKKITYMLSDKRGIILQKDIIDKIDNIDNKIYNTLIEEYKKIGFKLDTYTKNKNKLIMYFPR